MVIGREGIAGLIPHAGRMCLLDRVICWSPAAIRCVSHQHRAPDNPLRSHDRLGAACGVEFAAQAMALHGRLCAGSSEAARHGYLASLRQLACCCERLDLFAGELVIDAERLAGDERQALYHFTLSCDGRELMQGRAAVVMDAGAS